MKLVIGTVATLAGVFFACPWPPQIRRCSPSIAAIR